MTLPAEIVERLTRAMLPERVCKTCGNPSRPIREHLGRERFRRPPTPDEFAAFMREAMTAAGKSPEEVAAHLNVTPRMINFYLGQPTTAHLPSLERWEQLTEILTFPPHLLEAMEIVDREYETWDQADRSIPERLYKASDGPPKVVLTGFSDCGHDDWRSGSVLIFE